MPDNITRDTFDPTKGYTSVRMQQGRLQLDSDWNEQADIQTYLRRAQVVDMIGAGSGASKVDPITGEFSEQSFQLRKIATPLLAYELDTFTLRLASHEGSDQLPTEKDNYQKVIYIAKVQDSYDLCLFDQYGKLAIKNKNLAIDQSLRQELDEALEDETLNQTALNELKRKIFPAESEATDIAILPGHFYTQGILCELVPSSIFSVSKIPDKPNQLQVSPSLTIDGRRLKVGDWIIFADQSLKTIKSLPTDTTDTTNDPKENQGTGETPASATDNPQSEAPEETPASGETQDPLADDQPTETGNSGADGQQNTDAPDESTPPTPTIPALPGWRITRIVDTKTFTIEVAGDVSFINETAQMRRIVTYTSQPDWPVEFPSNSANPISQEQGRYFAYLDVWQRHITAVDDPAIREVALNGPDTTTRTKTVWQLKLRSAKDQNGQDLPNNGFKVPVATGEEFPQKWQTFESEERQRAPKLNACARLCENGNGVTANGRLGNFLYRVEIHTGNDPQAVNNNPSQAIGNSDQQQTVTFKWSRDNASVASSVKSIDGNVIRIAKSSQNAWADSKTDQWLELLTEAQELRGEPGILVPLKSAIDNKLEFNAARIIGGAIPKNVSKVRRWDHTETDAPQGAIPIRDQWIELENGIKVQFEVPLKTPSTSTNGNNGNQSAANTTNGGTSNHAGTTEPPPKIIYRTGDYWLIPSRAVTNDIEWPTDRADDDVSNQARSVSKPLPQPRRGVEHRYALLGIVDVDDENRINQIFDQRILFPPLLRALDKGGDTISGDLDIRGQFSVTGLEENGQRENDFPRFVVLENGHVGVNTADPKYELEVNGTIRTIDLDITGQFSSETFRGETFEIRHNPTEDNSVLYGKIQVSQTDSGQPTNPKKIEFVAEPSTSFSFLGGRVEIGQTGARQNLEVVGTINGQEILKQGQAVALQSDLDAHIGNQDNPHNVTAEQVDGDTHALINRINGPANDGERINQNRLNVDALETQVTTLDGRVNTLQGQVTAIDGRVNTLGSQVTTLDGRVNTLQDQVTTVDGQVNTLEDQVVNIDGRVNTLESQVTTISDQISGHLNATNPHGITAEGIGALPSNGGTLNGDVTVNGDITSEGKISARDATINNIQSGDYVQFSSASLKQDIVELTGQQVAEALSKLRPVQFQYRDDANGNLRAGFIAEEVPDLFATPDHQGVKLMDVIAILTKAVQDNRKMLKHLSNKIGEKDEEISKLKRALIQQKAQIKELQSLEAQSEGE